MNRAHRVSTSVAAATALSVALVAGSIGVAVGQSPEVGQSPHVATLPVSATLIVEGAWARVSPMMTGQWGVTVTGRATDGRTLMGEATTQVLDDAGSPPLGQQVVPVDTPTIVSSGYDLATVTTDPEPLQQLYLTSVRDALEASHAFVLVIDTLRPGVNSACGSALGEAHTIPGAFPGLWVMHAEPFVTDSGDAVLVQPPADGSADLAPWAAAWGVTEPPWLFVVDDDGTLWAKFQGIFGTDELLSALRGVAAYVPGGH